MRATSKIIKALRITRDIRKTLKRQKMKNEKYKKDIEKGKNGK